LGGLLHPTRNRYLGSRELARLQSFPDQYDWGDPVGDELANFRAIANRVGNSVPPLMMRAIANTIRTDILERIPVNA